MSNNEDEALAQERLERQHEEYVLELAIEQMETDGIATQQRLIDRHT